METEAKNIFIRNKLKTVTMFNEIQQNKEISLYPSYGLIDNNDNYISEFDRIGRIYIASDGKITIKNQDEFKFLDPIFNYSLSYESKNKNSELNDVFFTWTQEWKRKEIEENIFGHISYISKKVNFDDIYDKLTDEEKNKINYYAMIGKTLVYFEKMNCKYNECKSFSSINEFYSSGSNPYFGVINNYNSIGVDTSYSISKLFTPHGRFDIWSLNAGNKNRDDKIKDRLKMVETIPVKFIRNYGQFGPYLSIMKGIDGEELTKFEFSEVSNDYDKVKNFWQKNRDLILYRIMKSIKEKGLIVD